MKTGLVFDEIQGKLSTIVETLFSHIPSGVGSQGAIPKLTKQDEKRLLREGAEHEAMTNERFAQFIHMNRLLEQMTLQVIAKSSL